MKSSGWQIYRTRFLVKAKQLSEPMAFVDGLGREHRGQPGDYLIESSDGSRSIQRRDIFEDIYVPMRPPERRDIVCQKDVSPLEVRRRPTSNTTAWV